LTKHGHNDASLDEATILRWWKRWPRAGIGMRTGAQAGVVVLDADDYKGGGETLADREREHGKLPDGPISLTGGAGRHLFFKHPGVPVRSKSIGEGLDVKADGGYIVLPCSWHISGRPYAWDLETQKLPLPDLPEWVIEAANGSKDKVSSGARRGGPNGALDRHFRRLEDLLGPGRTSGKWTKYPCPFHPDSHPSLGVTPDGWVQCFGCDECGWIDTIIRRLTDTGNFVSGSEDGPSQDRVTEALEAAHLYRQAREMRACGRVYRVYQPKCGHRPAYPVSDKMPFCPRCRAKRLARHLAQKQELFEELTHPAAVRVAMPPVAISADEGDAKEALKAQTDRLLQALRILRKAIPQFKDTLRGVSPACRGGMLTVTHGLIVDDLSERDRTSVAAALGQLGATVQAEYVSDPARWLYLLAVRFDFETPADLRALVTLFRGTSIIRGWGEMRPATGGMGKGGGANGVPMCPCGKAPLGKALAEVPSDQVSFTKGFGYNWLGPPKARVA
jgi:hypothetical protein